LVFFTGKQAVYRVRLLANYGHPFRSRVRYANRNFGIFRSAFFCYVFTVELITGRSVTFPDGRELNVYRGRRVIVRYAYPPLTPLDFPTSPPTNIPVFFLRDSPPEIPTLTPRVNRVVARLVSTPDIIVLPSAGMSPPAYNTTFVENLVRACVCGDGRKGKLRALKLSYTSNFGGQNTLAVTITA